MKKLALIFLGLSTVLAGLAQGPGGIPTTNLVSWQTPSNIVTSGSNVIGWGDASPITTNDYGDHGSASERPSIVVGDANGFDVVRFDGSNDYLEGTGVSYSARSIFVVFKANSSLQSTSDLAQIWGHYASGVQLSLEARPGQGGPGPYSIDGNGNTQGKVAINGERFGSFAENTSSPTPWAYNNYTIATLELNANKTLTTQIIGDLISPANHNFGGEIAEIIVYSTVLDEDVEKLRINNYLGNKYGISLTYNTDNSLYTDADYNEQLVVIGNHSSIDYDTIAGNGGAIFLEKNAGSFGVNEKIWAAHNGSGHGISNEDVSGTSRWKRIFRVQRDNTSGSLTSVDISFGTKDAGFGDNNRDGAVIGDYQLLYRAGTSGPFAEVTGAVGALDPDQNKVTYTVNSADLVTGYYTLGIPGGNTWYSYLVNGFWSNPDMWTLDPSGTLYINSGGVIPGSSDEVVILNGKTVIDSSGNKEVAILNVKAGGILDIEDNTGNSFITINGEGTIRLKADNFPSYSNISDFGSRGKVEYYGDSYSVSTEQTFFNVDINLDLATNVITFATNLSVNGDLTIESGLMQIGDNTSSSRTIDLNQNLVVQSNGSINVDQTYAGSNVVHRLEIAGDFTNEGTCTFSDAGGYDPTGSLVDVQVDVRFNSSTSDQKVFLDGVTDFYRIVSDKGVDANYLLDIEASAAVNFNLFGKNNGGGGTGGTGENNNALGLKSGTVKLNNNIVIPELKSGSGNYDIPEGAILWLSNSEVTMTGQTALVAYGGVRVSEPLSVLNVYSGSGITIRELGFIEVFDGTVNLNQVRRSTNAGIHLGAYKQYGGYVTVADFGFNGPSSSFSLFDLCESSHTFEMTGGTLHIIEDKGGNNDGTRGAFFVNSDPEYFNVTGGTVIFESERSTASTLTISTVVDLPNVIFRNNTGNLIQFQTRGATGYNSNVISDSAFTVIGDLTIETADINFDHNGGDVVLFQDFNVVAGSSIEYDVTKQNTFIFTGSGNRKINFEHLSGSNYQDFYSVDVDMQLTTDTISLYGPNKDTTQNANSNVDNDLFRVNKSMYHREGVFDQRNFSITLKCDTIVNTGERFGYRTTGNPATDANSNNDRIRIMDYDNSGTAIYLYEDRNARWGTLDLDTDNDYVDLNEDWAGIQRFYFKSGRVNMNTYTFAIGSIITAFNGRASAGGYSSEDMFVAGGNNSDNGIGLSWGNNTSQTRLYPVGIGLGVDARYTPIEIDVTTAGSNNRTHYCVLVDDTLTTTDPAGGDILSMFWKMEYGWRGDEGSLPIVNIKIDYSDTDLDGSSNEGSFVGGRVLDVIPYTRASDLSTINTTTNTIDYTGLPTDNNTSYTAGENARFIGAPAVYYSRGVGGNSAANRLSWSDPNSWSNVGHYTGAAAATDYPDNGAVVYIGFNPTTDLAGSNGNHRVDLDVNADVALIFLDHNTVEDNLGNDYTEVNSGEPQLRILNTIDTAALGFVDGRGEIVLEIACSTCDVDPDVTVLDIPVITGDFATFGGGGNSDWNTFEYNLIMPANTVGRLPSTLPTIYPRLDINGNGTDGQAIIFTEDLDVRSRLRFYNDGSIWLNEGTNGDITVERGIRFFGGNSTSYMKYQDKGNPRTITCKEIFTMQSPGHRLFVDSTDLAGLEHQFVWGLTDRNDRYMDIEDGLIDFYVDDVNASQVIFDIQNYDTTIIYGNETNIPDFNRIKINTADTTFIRFNTNFNISGIANGSSSTKPLLINSGKVILEDADINIDISTGGDQFRILEGTELEIIAGQVNISGNSDLRLDGLLDIAGGTVDMAADGNTNNIQYTVGTGSGLTISDGSLLVGGHFMRQDDDDQAAINYLQSGGIARFGINGSEFTDRGIFEILGGNSSYTRSGGSMNIESGNGSVTTAAFLISNPATFSESGTSKIVIGGGVNAGAVIGINSTEAINTIEISGTGDNPIGNMLINTLRVQNLIIGNGSNLSANGLGIFVSDNWINNAGITGFTSSDNLTTFTFVARVDVSGDTRFGDVTNLANRMYLANNTEITTDDFKNDKSIYDGGNRIYVKGNLTNNFRFFSESASSGVVMNGTERQYITSERGTSINNTSFDKLIIDNSADIEILEYLGKTVRVIIYNSIQMNTGIFNLGDNYIFIFDDTDILGSPYDENKMIRVNGRTSSKGVELFLDPGSTFNDTIPLGSGGKYTPAKINLTNEDASKFEIIIKAIDDQHPTTLAYSGNLVRYYWSIYSKTTSGNVNGDFTFQYEQNDVFGNEGIYGAAKLETGDWILKVPDGITGPISADVDTSANQVFFNIPANSTQIRTNFTCGDTKTPSPNEAYPITIPTYVSQNNGNWKTAANWLKDGAIVEVPTIGSRVFIQSTHEITFDTNSINIYNFQLDGKIVINNTIKHNLGIVSGTGIIELESGQFPGGAYDEFFETTGGIVEYSGSGDYTTSSRVTAVRGLIFSGTGTRTIPALSTTVGDSILIDGVTVDNTVNNSSFDLEGDIAIRNGGKFLSGTGGINFIGTKDSHIKTAMTGDNQLAQMTIGKTAGDVYIDEDTVFVKNSIDFQKGRIIPGDNVFLMDINLSYVTQPWDSSYVEGNACKELINGGSFSFPVGDNYKYAYSRVNSPTAGTWCSRYHNSNPTADGYDITAFKAESSPLTDVSKLAYWDIEGPVSAKANGGVTLNWRFTNNPYPNIEDAAIGEWDAANSYWYNRGGSYNDVTKTLTTDSIIGFSKKQFAFASDGDPLPVVFGTFTAKSLGQDVVLDWSTLSEKNNDRFEIERSYDLKSFEYVGFVDGNGTSLNTNTYSFVDKFVPSGTIYYRLKQIDFNGDFEYSKVVVVQVFGNRENSNVDDFILTLYPNPVTNGTDVTFKFSKFDNVISVIIYDLIGNIVYTNNSLNINSDNEFKTTLNLGSGGLYIVKASSDNQSSTQRLIID